MFTGCRARHLQVCLAQGLGQVRDQFLYLDLGLQCLMRRSSGLMLELRMLGLDICRLGSRLPVGLRHATVQQSANPRVPLCLHLPIAQANQRSLRNQRIYRIRIPVMVLLVLVLVLVMEVLA